jgi:CYTH domain-containing protein
MKYAKIERERRFLLTVLPADLALNDGYQRIIDRYILGTRLRLRRMETATGETIDLKLTQKYDADGQPGERTIITNFYLNEAEYTLLLGLEARILTKRRYRYDWQGQRWSIDCFEGALQGLVLAEIEFASDAAMAVLEFPTFATTEVTHDARFTGGVLVTSSTQPAS